VRDPRELERTLGVVFHRQDLLEEALTHRSFRNETSDPSVTDFERLEFLGDSVLGLIVTDALVKACPHLDEGRLSRARSHLVSASNLIRYARRIDLGAYLRLGRGEEQSGGREKPALLVDAFEAVLGAVYLEGGIEIARQCLLGFIAEDLERIRISSNVAVDSKSQLQEMLKVLSGERVTYEVAAESGPDHRKWFDVVVRLDGKYLARGRGRSRKAAEQQAAARAVEALRDGPGLDTDLEVN